MIQITSNKTAANTHLKGCCLLRNFLTLSLLAAFFFSLAAAAPAQSAGAILEGIVTDGEGMPSPGTPISVWDGRNNYRAVTDDEGRFSLAGLNPGSSFAVRFSPAGHPSARADGLRFPEKGDLLLSLEHVSLKRGARHLSRLSSNPSTGYGWSLMNPGRESTARLVERGMETPQQVDASLPPLSGRGGTEVWTFEAAGRGEAVIVLGYFRPWEKPVSPARYHVLALTVR